MGLHIDHISLASPNIFESSHRLCQETGLGFWTGEWIRDTAVHIFPLGGYETFIEVSGIIDVHTLKQMDEHKQWILDITETGDHFNGLCLGVDSMEELEEQAKRLGSKVNPSNNPNPEAHFQRANGYVLPMASTPSGAPSVWTKGLPNFYYYPDRTHHSSGQPVHPMPGLVRPTGIKWVEMGGTEEEMSKWLGVPSASAVLPMKFNGKSLGLWAVCVGAEGRDDIVIRRPAASDAVPVSKLMK